MVVYSMAKTESILAETTIDGLDIPDAMARMGNSAKLYLRIIHTFITKMPENLEGLTTESINADTLSDYAIKIHGAKGSCYGIGANEAGDIAKMLEMAAKAGDLDTCLRKNESFLLATRELIEKLTCLEARVKEAESNDGRTQEARPDEVRLAALLAAAQAYDIDQMTKLVEELSNVSYTSGGEVVSQIKESLAAFDYQAIIDAITAYL